MERREKAIIYNTLNIIPLMLINKNVLIDLRNETSIAGRLVNADGYMNINLKEVVFIDQKGLQYKFDDFMVPQRMIRQIHLPKSFEFTKEYSNYLKKLTAKKVNKKERSLKVKKAYERHKETLQEIITADKMK